MPTPPSLRESAGLLLLSLQRLVLPPVFEQALIQLSHKQPLPTPDVQPLLGKIRTMKNDMELRFFLLESATIQEATLVVSALEFLQKVAREGSDERVQSLWYSLKQYPMLTAQLQTALVCIELQIRT